MYSGTTLRTKSGRIMGAHQKIDRVARKSLLSIVPKDTKFPKISEILHFEGKNGPDGIKSKSPSVDEPWHYIDPTKPDDREIFRLVNDHSHNLATALAEDNTERAAFEAAWLAHAIVDGLTPAHHFPLADKIEELWGHPHDERITIREKNLISGESRRDTISKNWEYWGAKGIFTTHFMFELGFASTISALRFSDLSPSLSDQKRAETEGIESIFEEAIRDIHRLGMYEIYYKKGWTRKVASQSREVLAPVIINVVTLSWYAAVKEAERMKGDKK